MSGCTIFGPKRTIIYVAVFRGTASRGFRVYHACRAERVRSLILIGLGFRVWEGFALELSDYSGVPCLLVYSGLQAIFVNTIDPIAAALKKPLNF